MRPWSRGRRHRGENRPDNAISPRRRETATVLMSMASGATDAIGYLSLGHVFTSAMTGNLVLLGISLAHHNGERVGRVFISLLCYMAGSAIGARIVRDRSSEGAVWPRCITRALQIETVIMIGYAGLWWATAGHSPDIELKAAILGCGAVAMGIQSTATMRFGVPGLNTTFMSGAVTTFVTRLATGVRFRDTHHHLLLMCGLVGGGLLGAVMVLHAPMFAPLVQLVPLAAVLLMVHWRGRVAGRARAGAGQGARESAKVS